MKEINNEIVFVQAFAVEKKLKISERGSVFLVRDKETKQRYIYRVFTGNPDVYRRMCGIECPYLPKIYGMKVENDRVHVLEEYVQGDTLAFLLEGRCLDAGYAKSITIQICKALKVLHGIGAVHRDVKPENIIIRGSEAILIDFDASRLCKTENTTDTQIMGTTGYAAPEQYGFSQTDARTDIYALGILLNEMLTKSHPSKQLADGAFRPIVEKCIQVNADKRYSSVDELISAINAPDRLRKILSGGMAAVLTAAILAGGIQLYVRNRAMSEDEIQNPVDVSSSSESKWGEDIPDVNVIDRERVEISEQIWEASTEGYATPFKCDMDGDGSVETYLFGMDFVDSPQSNVVYYDRNTCKPGFEQSREVYPCVWRMDTNGSLEVATEFAGLLTDAKIRIWRVDNLAPVVPEAWTSYQIWPGSVQITFSEETAGTWLYEVSAYFAGQQLTAQATTTIIYSD